MSSETLIYQSEDGALQLPVALENETVWLSQAQMVTLFGRDQSVVSRHIHNVFKDGELDEGSSMQKMHIANSDKPVVFYSLDVIISVGYRIKSQQGVKFRQWATQTLKQHLLQGYTINRQRFEQNAHELEQALLLINKAIQTPSLTTQTGKGLVDIISRYKQTFLWLQRYDEGLLTEPTGQVGGDLADLNDALSALNELKLQLMAREEATELFSRLRSDGLSAIWGNLQQTIFGEPAYATIESKAAHLLYFVVKNHPFVDGNKRSGAFLFVDFLHRNSRLYHPSGEAVINDNGLAAITLLVAESNPAQKETIIRLIMNMLSQEKRA